MEEHLDILESHLTSAKADNCDRDNKKPVKRIIATGLVSKPGFK